MLCEGMALGMWEPGPAGRYIVGGTIHAAAPPFLHFDAWKSYDYPGEDPEWSPASARVWEARRVGRRLGCLGWWRTVVEATTMLGNMGIGELAAVCTTESAT
jgi:hypothetical protein